MPDEINPFREWMDQHGIKGQKAEQLASKIGISTQTLAHWRSQGVPERRMPHVQFIMGSWPDEPQQPPVAMGQNLVVHPTREQFRAWSLAALEAKLPIDEWAVQGLDRLAEEWEADKKRLRVADNDATYIPQEKRSHGT